MDNVKEVFTFNYHITGILMFSLPMMAAHNSMPFLADYTLQLFIVSLILVMKDEEIAVISGLYNEC